MMGQTGRMRAKRSRSLAALNSRCRRTMAGLPLVDEVNQRSRAAGFYWQVASACSSRTGSAADSLPRQSVVSECYRKDRKPRPTICARRTRLMSGPLRTGDYFPPQLPVAHRRRAAARLRPTGRA